MIPHHVYYQLSLLVCLWLCIIAPPGWPSRSTCPPPKPSQSVPSQGKRKRSNEPKAFEGLTQRPPCAACAHDAHHPQASPPRRPEPMPATHRRRRVIDTARHFCPHVGCDYRGWLGPHNLRPNGNPSGGPWRQLQCTSCEGYFLETHGTILGSAIHVMLALRPRSRQVVVTDEELNGPDMVGKLLGKRQRAAHQP